jgi:RimJ/RimL family protein N-acetyltransferase
VGITEELGGHKQDGAMTAQIVIHTARLALRLVREGDEDRLFPLFAHWEVIRWLSSPPWPYTREDMQSFIRQQEKSVPKDPETRFVIELDDELIGVIGVRMRPASHVQRAAGPHIGYWLGQPFWGHGYMTEALAGTVRHVFATPSHDAIYSGIFVGNAASLRVQEKVGFVRDGETMLHSRPRGAEFPHVNTVLTRSRFALH